MKLQDVAKGDEGERTPEDGEVDEANMGVSLRQVEKMMKEKKA